jgi:hypothetical protein
MIVRRQSRGPTVVVVKACPPQKLDRGRQERMGATRLDLRDHGAEDRSMIDLLRNVVAVVLRFFAARDRRRREPPRMVPKVCPGIAPERTARRSGPLLFVHYAIRNPGTGGAAS